jgi:hypothetical protein
MWPSIPGTDRYEVSVSGAAGKWTYYTPMSELRYPANTAMKLNHGGQYTVAITPYPDLKLSAGGIAMTTALSVIGRPTPEAVNAASQVVVALNLSPHVRDFLVARLKARAGEHASAIELLENVRRFLNEPAVDRELADVHAAIGNVADAQRLLTGALPLFEMNGDLVGRALAAEALAKLEIRSVQEIDAAIGRLRGVYDTYVSVGDSIEAARIDALLKNLEQVKVTMKTRRPLTGRPRR